jgi:transcription initiation factor TFIID TATA-box-binding protein
VEKTNEAAMIIHPPEKKFSAKYKIENVVINSSLNHPIPLDKLSQLYRDLEYNPTKFPGLCIRLRIPKCAILLFSNGKLVITGLKSPNHAVQVLEKLIEKMKALNIEIQEIPKYQVVNFVVSIDLGKKINLDRASLFLGQSIYEPEVFPGLIFRVTEPFASAFLIFSSGKIVLTGLRNEAEIAPSIKAIGKLLKDNNLLENK